MYSCRLLVALDTCKLQLQLLVCPIFGTVINYFIHSFIQSLVRSLVRLTVGSFVRSMRFVLMADQCRSRRLRNRGPRRLPWRERRDVRRVCRPRRRGVRMPGRCVPQRLSLLFVRLSSAASHCPYSPVGTITAAGAFAHLLRALMLEKLSMFCCENNYGAITATRIKMLVRLKRNAFLFSCV